MTTPTPLQVRSHPRCLEHDTGLGHPETARRIQVVLDALEHGADGRWVVDRQAVLPPDEDVLGVLRWVHDAGYIERVREASEEGTGWLDTQDCRVSKGTFDAALAAAGLALNAGLDLVNRRLDRAFLVIRPPGHLARRDAAMGFCFFNTVAVAAEVVVGSWKRPVLVVDFDGHHGIGTQEHFYDRPDVGYVSVHAFPAFPGTGGADETGTGDAIGTTRNVPLMVGADDATACEAFETALAEVATRLQPAALVVSAGFNGHSADPMRLMRLSEAGYRRMSAAVTATAQRWSEGRILSFLEGGYDPQALANCARIHVEELATSDADKADA
jgi:acetoin utilization deacetylase AcuC-like enzyme